MNHEQNASKWASLPYHRHWLLQQANSLFDFFQYRAMNSKGGFFDLDDQPPSRAGTFLSSRRSSLQVSQRRTCSYLSGYG
ncbi:hypothetical protein At15955_54440 (plasmid) [Agrobacterium tumefaciens]|uniref:Mannose-6-phosphate isomerase n=2 Tax=Agrobacterium tumefaciens TaxID=358 RepID=A0A2Z2PF47_AGRTU|nr:hypothetical protein Ach5_51930 [Agrobacterium tumefaciens]ASK41577.1 hypothetical protein [Agrobacterium tumefaciens]ASK47128.1 hypothetical protein [Agrobacterium radiobacter]CUX06633.1 hypothetical protein AGR1C_pTi0054 [Agrobacterium fabacearum TT111]CVI25474.1 hypothetical protein AGR4A_pTi0072 [Agrobacterium tumefaciens str. B6]